MEFLMTAVLLLTAGSLTALCCTVLLFLLQRERSGPTAAPAEQSEEEKQALRLAAEAQKRYEQGFVNLMSYDGSPAARKEADLR